MSISAFFSRAFRDNLDSYYGTDLRVPSEAFASEAFAREVLATPEVDRVVIGNEKPGVRSAKQGPTAVDYRASEFSSSPEMTSAARAYKPSHGYAGVKKHLDLALAKATTSEHALVVAQFAWDHFFQFTSFVPGIQALFGATPGTYDRVAYYGVDEGIERAVALARTPNDIHQVLGFAASIRDRGPVGTISVFKNDGVADAYKKLLPMLRSTSESLQFLRDRSPISELEQRGAWSVVHQSLLMQSQTPIDLDNAEAAIKLLPPMTRSGLEQCLALKRKDINVKLRLDPWVWVTVL